MNKDMKLEFLYKMMLIREFENAVSEYKDKKMIYGGTHCYNGEEAVAVGVCGALHKTDYIVSNHRPHGHAIAKGMDPKKIMAEIFGKSEGSNEGKGGSMHIMDMSVGLVTSSGIVGSGVPVGCGTAFASKYKKDGRISCVFFGDGSANEGVLHESLNLAAKWELPVLFLLEDNELAITTNTRDTSACNDYVRLAAAYGIKGVHVDGQNVEDVYAAASEATTFIRENSCPFFIQAHTIRFSEHAEGDYYKRMISKGYRNYENLEKEKDSRCPIKLYELKLKNENIIKQAEVETLIEKVKKEVVECIEYAIQLDEPIPDAALTNVYRE